LAEFLRTGPSRGRRAADNKAVQTYRRAPPAERLSPEDEAKTREGTVRKR